MSLKIGGDNLHREPSPVPLQPLTEVGKLL